MIYLSEEQLKQLEAHVDANGVETSPAVSLQAMEVYWLFYPELNFDVAVGGLRVLLSGKGQVRNERLEAPGETSEDLKRALEPSLPVSGSTAD